MADDHPFPTPQCELFFERALRPIANGMLKLTNTFSDLVEKYEQLGKTVHGENYDNGLALAVKEHTIALKELKELPSELRGQVTRWGFYLLGLVLTIFTVTITIFVKLLEGA